MAICADLSSLCFLLPGEALRLRGRSLGQPAAAAGRVYDRWALVLNGVVDRDLSLSRLRPHLYSLCHGGASEATIRELRTPEQVQRMGKWGHSGSMRRYAGESELLVKLHWVPAATLSYGKLVEASFRFVIEGALAGGPHPRRSQVPAALAGLVGARPSLAAAAGRGQKRRRR